MLKFLFSLLLVLSKNQGTYTNIKKKTIRNNGLFKQTTKF